MSNNGGINLIRRTSFYSRFIASLKIMRFININLEFNNNTKCKLQSIKSTAVGVEVLL